MGCPVIVLDVPDLEGPRSSSQSPGPIAEERVRRHRRTGTTQKRRTNSLSIFRGFGCTAENVVATRCYQASELSQFDREESPENLAHRVAAPRPLCGSLQQIAGKARRSLPVSRTVRQALHPIRRALGDNLSLVGTEFPRPHYLVCHRAVRLLSALAGYSLDHWQIFGRSLLVLLPDQSQSRDA